VRTYRGGRQAGRQDRDAARAEVFQSRDGSRPGQSIELLLRQHQQREATARSWHETYFPCRGILPGRSARSIPQSRERSDASHQQPPVCIVEAFVVVVVVASLYIGGPRTAHRRLSPSCRARPASIRAATPHEKRGRPGLSPVARPSRGLILESRSSGGVLAFSSLASASASASASSREIPEGMRRSDEPARRAERLKSSDHGYEGGFSAEDGAQELDKTEGKNSDFMLIHCLRAYRTWKPPEC